MLICVWSMNLIRLVSLCLNRFIWSSCLILLLIGLLSMIRKFVLNVNKLGFMLNVMLILLLIWSIFVLMLLVISMKLTPLCIVLWLLGMLQVLPTNFIKQKNLPSISTVLVSPYLTSNLYRRFLLKALPLIFIVPLTLNCEQCAGRICEQVAGNL